ncbi:hypothetical protein COCOR_06885 [Corallococcus coralloides DSM 2259]|uniref:DUF1963 domain-containing protein n=1 Tax=Corallococcus coralloides (strain ATCC 25202 / DSM 2259 / NBRC 100086 / M2) TaxID=1144275 RepID=H8N129_CORCM|nr:hypothetical protein [Corallococcus coralloides]AFE07195.1 hypothetical protein COCOR_06885 [Corallococcus coralloides DSM 2259]
MLAFRAMSGQKGTIVELNPIDALGWIELDEGGRVRFGGTALKSFAVSPSVGTRVEVHGTAPGYKGVPKAVMVTPLVVAPAATEEPKAEPSRAKKKTPWPTFVREHPRWSDVAETCVPCARKAPRPELPEHPLFAPWRRELCETAPTCVDLKVPHYLKPESFEPGPGDCFAHGPVAWLDEPRWPSCGVCARPLEMCVQIAPAVLADFLPGGRGLAALFCFHCGIEKTRDPRVAYVRLVEPRHRVTAPEAWKSTSNRLRRESQRVTPASPATELPPANWYRCRLEITPETASSALFGFDTLELDGPFPEGFDPDRLEEVDVEYDDWLAQQRGGARWGGARLGGVAGWELADATPSCAHGEMLHLLDYAGGQFLEGALHVFSCRERVCELAFVAEF